MTNELWFDLDKAAREEVADPFRQVPLENWDLSARTKNALLRSNPSMSIGDVIAAGREIAATRGLGSTAIQELHTKVAVLLKHPEASALVTITGTSNAQPGHIGQWRLPPNDALGPSSKLHRFDKYTLCSMNELWFETDKSSRDEIASLLQLVPLRNWKLSARVSNALLRHDVSMSIGDVVAAGPEIVYIKGLGPTAFHELHAKVVELLENPATVQKFLPPLASTAVNRGLVEAPLLPDDVLGLSIKLLQLSPNTQKALIRAGFLSIGGLARLTQADLKRIAGLSPQDQRSALLAIRILADSVSQEGQVEWIRYYRAQDIHFIPNHLPELPTPSDIVRALPSTLKGVILAEHEERMWFVVQRRYGLQNTEKLTLNELGEAFDLTRERVRQIESRAREILRRAFVETDFAGRGFRVHPAILQSIHQVVKVFGADGDEVTRESDLLLETEKLFGESVKRSWPEIFLILTLFGFDRVEFAASDLDPVWVRSGSLNVSALKRQVEELDRLLTVERTLWLDELDVLRHLNASLAKKGAKKLTLVQLRQLKRICSTIEERPDGSLWGKFEHLRGRGNQVERLLLEAGEPLTINEIARRLNHRMVKAGQRKIGIRSLVGQLGADSRIVAIGRSGYWGLRAWPDMETTSIADLIEHYLITHDKPATSEEILRYVSERRRVQLSSIVSTLSMDERFGRTSSTTWGLASWPEAKNAKVWNRAEVAAFLIQLFRDKKTTELEYSEVIQALARAADISEERAETKLRNNRVLRTRKDVKRGKRIAFLALESVETLPSGRPRSASGKVTGRELIQTAVRRLLSAAPDHVIALRDLMALVQRELGSKEKTVYAYIREMDDVERVMLSETRLVICRLKRSPEPTAYTQVLQISTPEIRAKVERTLPYLTEDAVDVGLFLLSKEFEAILKDFIVAAIEAGKLSSTPGPDPSKWKLNNMVDIVAKEGLIIDKSILHYLREERNARAHGTMPSLAERQLMMNNASHLASLYIDYIKLFDDLRRSL